MEKTYNRRRMLLPGRAKTLLTNLKWKDILIQSTCILLILLFSYTAVSKLLDQHTFVFQMGLVPMPLMKTAAPALGWIVPIAELMIALILCTPKWRTIGLYCAFSLLLLFTFYIAGMLLSGLELPCTCGGIISTLSWKNHLLFNGFFILMTGAAIQTYRSNVHTIKIPE